MRCTLRPAAPASAAAPAAGLLAVLGLLRLLLCVALVKLLAIARANERNDALQRLEGIVEPCAPEGHKHFPRERVIPAQALQLLKRLRVCATPPVM